VLRPRRPPCCRALDGWVRDAAPTALPIRRSRPSNAAALKEYDYNGRFATYKREGETLSIRALRFRTRPALMAYSFYRQNGWLKEDIGPGHSSTPRPLLEGIRSSMRPSLTSAPCLLRMRELAHHIPIPEPCSHAAVLRIFPTALTGRQRIMRSGQPLCGSVACCPRSDWLRSRPEAVTANYISPPTCHAHHH